MGSEMGLWKWDFGNGTSVPSNKKELGLKSHFRKAEWWVLRPTSEKAKKKVEQKPNLLERKLFSKSLRAGIKIPVPKRGGNKFPLPKRN